MREHVKAGEAFVRDDVTPDAALERFKGEGQDYKVELIEDLVSNNGVDSVSLYTNGPFTDLCRGPHAPSTDRIKAFKLLSVAGAYWRGDTTTRCSPASTGRPSTPRTTSPPTSSASSRPASATTQLGRELGLFSFSELGPGSAFWTNAGTSVYDALVARRARCRSARLPGDQDPAALRPEAVEDLRPLGQVPREHVRHGVRDRPRALSP